METWEIQAKVRKSERLLKDVGLAATRGDARAVANAIAKIGGLVNAVRRALSTAKKGPAASVAAYRQLALNFAAATTIGAPGSTAAHIAEGRVAHVDCNFGTPDADTIAGAEARARFWHETMLKIGKLETTTPEEAELKKAQLRHYGELFGTEQTMLERAMDRAKEGGFEELLPTIEKALTALLPLGEGVDVP